MQGERDVIYSSLEYLNWHDAIFDTKRATRKRNEKEVTKKTFDFRLLELPPFG